MGSQWNKVPELEDWEINAIKHCWDGTATDGQQRIALETIINKLATADVIAFEPGAPDEGAFLAGRTFVGKQIRRVLRMKTGENQ